MTPRIREVHLRNYRSIERAVVPLSGFTVLVGPNGAGKTNFVDALAFVQECLSSSVDAALRDRGGLLRIKTGPRPPWADGVGFRLLIELAPNTVADYAFEIVLRREGNTEILEERCVISVDGKERVSFVVRAGQFDTPIRGLRASIERDRLALYAASAIEEFRPLYDFLTGIRAYAIQPEKLREPRDPSSGLSLEREGGNAAAVLRHVAEHHADRYERLIALLTTVVPGIQHVEGETIGGMQFLLFGENRGSAEEPLTLFPSNMSDGTLRMLGLLLAVYQSTTPTVLMIEEPEATIHPAAVDVVMSVLLDAAKRSQVIVTTHSPDVLDYGSLPEGAIRVVTRTQQRGTVIAPVANSSREAMRQRLYSPGELLRSDELNADVKAADSLSRDEELFGDPVHVFSEDA